MTTSVLSRRGIVLGALGAAIACALVLFVWRSERDSGSLAQVPAGATPAPVSLAEETSSIESAEGSREPLSADSGAASDAAPEATPGAPPEARPVEASHVSIRGRVLDERGERPDAPHVSVEARDEHGTRFCAPDREDGAYEIRDLAAGTYWVSAQAPGWRSEAQRADLSNEAQTAEVDLVLTRSPNVLVRARTPSGGSFAAALAEQDAGLPWPQIVASREPPSGDALDPTTADSATFHNADRSSAIESGLLGELELLEEPPLFASLMLGHRRLATERLDPFAPEIVFVLDPEQYAHELSSLRFRVVDGETGEPIAGVLASLSTNGVHSSQMVPVRDGGLAEFEYLMPGPALLTVVEFGFQELRRELVLLPGDALDLGDVELEPAIRLSGRVNCPQNAKELQIRYRSKEGLGRSPHQSVQFGFYLEEPGTFSLQLGSGESIIWADAVVVGVPWRARAKIVDPAAFSGELLLELEPTVPFLVRSSRAAEDRHAIVIDETGRELEQQGQLSGGPVRFDVLPGPQRLVLVESSGARQERSVKVGPGGLELDLD